MSGVSQTAGIEPVPYRPFSYLEANARSTPQRPAVIDGDTQLSFSELLAAVHALMTLVAAQGVVAGDVVAVSLPNVWSYVALEIAIPALGAIIMPLPPALGAHEIGSALQRSGALLLIAASERDPAVQVAASTPLVRGTLCCPLDLEAKRGEPPARPAATGAKDIVQIALTSGTTGPPKLAAFSAELKQLTFEGFTSRLKMSGEDRVLPLSPITQGAGEMFLYALRSGACLVMSGAQRFDPALALALADRTAATVIGGVPTLLSRMVERDRFGRTALSSLRVTAVAGAPLAPDLARAWESATGAPVVSFYGAMDIGQLSVPSPDDPPQKRWCTVGRPHERAEWAILGPEGKPVPHGAEGEICMRGPLVQRRYWDQEAGPFAADGWAHFGDLGFVDAEGFLHVTGRVKDTIIRGGNNVNPYEVEDMLRAHPAVAEGAVVGRPDADLGERAVAFVVPRDRYEINLEGLRRLLDERGLARYKWPEELYLLDELPLGPTGKVLRAELRKRAITENELGGGSAA